MASVLLLLIAGAAGAQMEQQVVAVGAQTVVRVDFPIGRSALANDTVADFRILESRQEILLLGRQAGETTLSLWDQQGTLRREILIRVRPSSGGARQITEELQELLGGIEGIEYREVGGTVWIEGEVLTERDLDRIAKVLESYPEVRSLVELSPMTQQMMDRAEADSVKTVQMDVTIMEVDKQMLRSLGVKWAGSVNPSSTLPFEGSSVGPISGVISNILPSINMMTSTGKARVLAQPTLITKSGQKAELFVGGELPIPVSQGGGGISIEYKEYGVKLQFEPKVDTQDNIDTAIFVEMSTLGGPVAGGAPGLITNRVNTSVYVKTGDSITLGGLVQASDAENVDKVPGLGNIPVLGNLFKSKQFIRNQTEMLVFATPRVVTAAEAGAGLKDKVTGDFEEFDEIQKHSPKQEEKKKKKQ
ncbi:MAG TPA: pilus assembly protein N-terminal domain-containing protein [Vicinamibacteria bacterium]|nr:pilus assembly protein N-terminal domain-containing protein [Vicinamibacteria bacterium]